MTAGSLGSFYVGSCIFLLFILGLGFVLLPFIVDYADLRIRPLWLELTIDYIVSVSIIEIFLLKIIPYALIGWAYVNEYFFHYVFGANFSKYEFGMFVVVGLLLLCLEAFAVLLLIGFVKMNINLVNKIVDKK